MILKDDDDDDDNVLHFAFEFFSLHVFFSFYISFKARCVKTMPIYLIITSIYFPF